MEHCWDGKQDVQKAVQQGRSERRGESHSLWYVEPLSDARTPLAFFFNILLGVLVTAIALYFMNC